MQSSSFLFVGGQFGKSKKENITFKKTDAKFNLTANLLNYTQEKYSGLTFYNNKYDAENEAHLHSISHKTGIQLAVVGGKYLRLIMGKSHPRYYYAEKFITEENVSALKNHFRFSFKVPGESEVVSSVRRIGDIVLLIVCYFLCDNDHDESNFINEKINNAYLVKKIDPEFAFSEDFAIEDQISIQKHLNYIYHFKFKEETITFDDNKDPDLEYYEDALFDFKDAPSFYQWVFSCDNYKKSPAFVSKLKDDAKRIEELFVGLSLILNCTTDSFRFYLDKVISDNEILEKELLNKNNNQFSFIELCKKLNVKVPDTGLEFKEILMTLIGNRLHYFGKAAYNLPYFKHFFENKIYLQTESYQFYAGKFESKPEFKPGR